MPTLHEAECFLIAEAEKMPLLGSVTTLHALFRRLAEHRFQIADEPWLVAFELAAVGKYIYLLSHGRRVSSYDLTALINAYKDLWQIAEIEAHYADDPEQLACFIIRFVYQQIPFHLFREKMQQNFVRTLKLFGGDSDATRSLSASFEDRAGVDLDTFLKVAHAMFEIFRSRASVSELDLERALCKHFSSQDVRRAVNVVAASRGQFRGYFEKLPALTPCQIPYQFNPILRYPILSREGRFWCVFPELINYAATRGLYFYIMDQLGAEFSMVFSSAFEEYLTQLCRDAFGAWCLITEAQERSLGWKGKTNDLTLVLGDTAVLFECKNSGLFAGSKRSAEPKELLADIRKMLANAKDRKGLFQLHDKIASIKARELPPALEAKYSGVKEFYPVLLLYDEIWFANRPEVFKNLVDIELRHGGVSSFDYQIWHVEELEQFIALVPAGDFPTAVKEKFETARFRPWDLSSYVADRTGVSFLKTSLHVPTGETPALRILRRLADAD